MLDGLRNKVARRLEVRPAAACTTPVGFYDVSPSCQIPNLGFLYEQFFGHEVGTFVEVGAYDGYSFSNTSCLTGWRGFYIEPVPEFAARCAARYVDNPEITVSNLAIGASCDDLTIHVGGVLSTANTALIADYEHAHWANEPFDETIVVEQTTLGAYLTEYGVAPGFDLLVVDVEGFETEVFRGFDLARWHPTAMIVELADAHPDLPSSDVSDAALYMSILERGYVPVFKDAINTFFVTTESYRAAHQ